jgi:3-phenylpropionate/cinnamic acid dioxygenase small subunit
MFWRYEIFTESAMSLNDKRFARDISALSVIPKEQEVLFRIVCVYRVHYKKVTDGTTIIGKASYKCTSQTFNSCML